MINWKATRLLIVIIGTAFAAASIAQLLWDYEYRLGAISMILVALYLVSELETKQRDTNAT